MTSAHVRAALAALVATVALLGSLLTVTTAHAATTTARAATKEPVRFGVSYGERLSRMSQSELDAVLDDAVLLGVRWIRIDFSWTTIQPKGPTSYVYAGTDRVVEAARARGLRRLWAQVGSLNAAMLGLFRRHGFSLVPEPGVPLVHATLTLS